METLNKVFLFLNPSGCRIAGDFVEGSKKEFSNPLLQVPIQILPNTAIEHFCVLNLSSGKVPDIKFTNICEATSQKHILLKRSIHAKSQAKIQNGLESLAYGGSNETAKQVTRLA